MKDENPAGTATEQVRTVCVYCASSPRTAPEYLAIARELGTTVAQAGMTVLYGGGAVGMMGAVADAALAAGGQVVGVRPTFISRFEAPHPGVAEMIFTETMHERKQILVDRADAFVTLPGAIGTLDELVETITWKRLGLHGKPICILSTDGLFDPLLELFRRMVDRQLVAEQFLSLFTRTTSVAETMDVLRQHTSSRPTPVIWDEKQPTPR